MFKSVNKSVAWKFYFMGLISLQLATMLMADELPRYNLKQEGRIMNPRIEPIAGGFNPEYFGYKISGYLLRGSNDCEARNVDARLQHWLEDGVLIIAPLRVGDRDLTIACPALSRPVFQFGELELRYAKSDVQKIMIVNIGYEAESLEFTP